MAVEKIVTLCKEGDSTTEYYPNIKGDNIPVSAVAKTKLTIELQDEIDGKAPQSTTYTKTEVDNKLSGKVNVATYNAKVSELENALDDKADVSDVYTKSQVYNKTEIDLMLENKADTDDVYTKTATDDLLNDKADKSTTYTKTETDALLDGKQATLVSGTNIKTINNTSILGSGNIDTIPSYEEITITGTLTDGHIEFEYAPLSSGIYLIHNGTIKPTLIYINNNLPYNYEGSGTGAEYGDDTTINVLLSTSMLTLYNPTGSQFNLNENNFKIKRLL